MSHHRGAVKRLLPLRANVRLGASCSTRSRARSTSTVCSCVISAASTPSSAWPLIKEMMLPLIATRRRPRESAPDHREPPGSPRARSLSSRAWRSPNRARDNAEYVNGTGAEQGLACRGAVASATLVGRSDVASGRCRRRWGSATGPRTRRGARSAGRSRPT